MPVLLTMEVKVRGMEVELSRMEFYIGKLSLIDPKGVMRSGVGAFFWRLYG